MKAKVCKEVMTVEEFLRYIEEDTDVSGFGYWGKLYKGKKEKTSKRAIPSEVKQGKGPPKWASFVFWYDNIVDAPSSFARE